MVVIVRVRVFRFLYSECSIPKNCLVLLYIRYMTLYILTKDNYLLNHFYFIYCFGTLIIPYIESKSSFPSDDTLLINKKP